MASKGIRKLIAAFLLLAAMPLSAQNDGEPQDSIVRLLKAESLQLIEKFNRPYRKAIDATFLHSGTYLICDTALWNVDAKIINAQGHVKLIQGETELTSDKLDYYVDAHLAQFRGELVQLRNKENNILRTNNLDYNTADSIAVFHSGASMRDAEGQVIESLNGTYDSGEKLFSFHNNVNMFTDSVFVKTQELQYDCNISQANFVSPIEFWQDENMLSARGGWYNRNRELFFFTGKVHALSEEQEAWCDTMYFYRIPRNIEMFGNAQIQDTSRRIYGMADYIFYADSSATLVMKKDAAVAFETVDGKVRDTLYFGADNLKLSTLERFRIPEEELAAAVARKSDIMTDPVMAYRRKAAEDAAKAAAEAIKNDPNRPHPPAPGVPEKDDDKFRRELEELHEAEERAVASADTSALVLPPIPENSDSLLVVTDTLAAPADSVVTAGDMAAAPDSVLAAGDSLAVADSANVVLDSTKINFLTGVGHVRAFRKDIQVLCDSLRYCDLDSIARFYIDPVVWNEKNRQYSSDSLFILVKGRGIDRASLMSNAFIITMEDSLYFDQIKSTDVMAYFDSTSALRRFDALGGASAMFFLQENDAYATVNRVETKMMSAQFRNGELSRVFYFESPKNDALPLAQMRQVDLKMKGFNWRIDERPRGPEDITSLKIKSTERSYYSSRPRASFPETDIYFPGYMASVYKTIAMKKERKRQNELRRQAVQDSLARVSAMDTAMVSALDSTAVAADSLVTAKVEELVSGDTTAVSSADGAAAVAAAVVVAETGVALTGSAAKAAEKAAAKAARAAEAQARREQAELARALRIAERDARWARLDSLDAAKAQAKEQKKLERKRERTRAAYRRQLAQQYKDEYKLQLQMEKVRKQYLKEEAAKAERAARQAARNPAKVPETVEEIKEATETLLENAK